MKTTVLSFLAVLTLFGSARAQDHLVPETGPGGGPEAYLLKVNELFGAAQREEIICQVTIIPSFVPEKLVGIRKTATAHEVFTITAASSIWNTELVRLQEAGRTTKFNKQGKRLGLEEDKSFQDLKSSTPADFRQIKTVVQAAAIDETLALQVRAIWERMLLATRQPKEPHHGFDGVSYHFSMAVSGRGILGGQIWSPDEKSKTGALVDVAYSLAGFANGKVDLAELKKAITRAEKITKN